MAYWRVIFKGSLGTVEQWSTSVAFGVVGLSPDVPDQATTEALCAAIAAVTTTALVPTGAQERSEYSRDHRYRAPRASRRG